MYTIIFYDIVNKCDVVHRKNIPETEVLDVVEKLITKENITRVRVLTNVTHFDENIEELFSEKIIKMFGEKAVAAAAKWLDKPASEI